MQQSFEQHPPRERRVVDSFTRVLHAVMALSFFAAYLTSEADGLRLLHVTMGYTLVAVVLVRAVWGLLGPRRVRLSALAGRVRGLGDTLMLIKGLQWQGLMAQALALSMVTLLLCAVPVVASGYVTYLGWSGEWTEEVHETLANFMVVAVTGHVGVVVLLTWLGLGRQVRPMRTGRVRGPGPDLVKHNLVALAVAFLLAVAGFWSWQTYQYAVDPQFAHQPRWLHPLGGYQEGDED